jgi:hypothetical protein
MLPSLRPGDWLLAVAGPLPRRGSLVVVEHPLKPGFEMVKQIDHLPGETIPGHEPQTLGPDEYWLVGTNEGASTDSRALGPIADRRIRGVVLLRYRPLRRFALLR